MAGRQPRTVAHMGDLLKDDDARRAWMRDLHTFLGTLADATEPHDRVNEHLGQENDTQVRIASSLAGPWVMTGFLLVVPQAATAATLRIGNDRVIPVQMTPWACGPVEMEVGIGDELTLTSDVAGQLYIEAWGYGTGRSL